MTTQTPNPTRRWEFRIWGCNGGVSVGGDGRALHGGLTTCLELDLPDARIIIDAGTGLPHLGRVRGVDRKPTRLLMSHLHWDHVVGLPHWHPLFAKDWDLEVHGVPREGAGVWDWMTRFNGPPAFPVPLADAAGARVATRDLESSGGDHFGGVDYRWMEVAHPGGCSAFSFDVGGLRIVFSGDLEVSRMDRDALLQFCEGADVLIMDAQYTEGQYPRHDGWGHSTNLQAASIAAEAGVGRLLLSHHDLRHDDAALQAMAREAREAFEATESARCGMIVAEGVLDE